MNRPMSMTDQNDDTIIMLQSHEAPGQFTGPLRTEIKGQHDFLEEFWTRTGAV